MERYLVSNIVEFPDQRKLFRQLPEDSRASFARVHGVEIVSTESTFSVDLEQEDADRAAATPQEGGVVCWCCHPTIRPSIAPLNKEASKRLFERMERELKESKENPNPKVIIK